MSQLRLLPNRSLASVPSVDGSVEGHTLSLKAIREHIEMGSRHTKDILNSYVRVQDLVELGVIRVENGNLAVAQPPKAPGMSTAERDGLSNPGNGVLIYNTTTDKLQVRAAGAWVDLH